MTAVKADPAGTGPTARLGFLSNDAAIVSVGRPNPLPAPVFASSQDVTEGAGYLLWDNT